MVTHTLHEKFLKRVRPFGKLCIEGLGFENSILKTALHFSLVSSISLVFLQITTFRTVSKVWKPLSMYVYHYDLHL